ncbi:DUF2147 family protein [Elusimicrobium posterum]
MEGQPSFCGLILVRDLKLNNRGIYTGGTITDPSRGRNYRAEMWINENGNLIIKGRWGVFWKKQKAYPFTERQLEALFTL